MKAYELLEKPENWTQGTACRVKETQEADLPSQARPGTHCFCVIGAIGHCYNDSGYQVRYNLYTTIENEVGMTIAKWNDLPERTHSEVYSLLKELNI